MSKEKEQLSTIQPDIDGKEARRRVFIRRLKTLEKQTGFTLTATLKSTPYGIFPEIVLIEKKTIDEASKPLTME